jgi:hypothetical protein
MLRLLSSDEASKVSREQAAGGNSGSAAAAASGVAESSKADVNNVRDSSSGLKVKELS